VFLAPQHPSGGGIDRCAGMHSALLEHLALIIRLTLGGPGDPRPQPIHSH
jgi:hypothetical protein